MYEIKSTTMQFPNRKLFNYTFAGRPLSVEVGKMAGLANGSCLVRYGDTAVLCCATASEKPRDGIDFLPLSVDYEERMYAAGKIPGGYLKREGKPSEKAILTARVIDRPIRPLFPKDLRNDVALTLTVMSVDQDCSPEITAMLGASIALSISDIPWNGPIGGVFMGLVDGELVVNPTEAQRAKSDLDLTVAASMGKVVMIEAGANEVADDVMYDAIMKAHAEIKELLGFVNAIIDEVGKPKFSYPSCELDHDMFDKIFAFCEADLMNALDTDDKNVRDERMVPIEDAILEKFGEEYPDLPVQMPELVYKMQKKVVRRWLLEGKRRRRGNGKGQQNAAQRGTEHSRPVAGLQQCCKRLLLLLNERHVRQVYPHRRNTRQGRPRNHFRHRSTGDQYPRACCLRKLTIKNSFWSLQIRGCVI